MPTQGTILFNLFTSSTDITNLVDDRVYPIEREQGEGVPAIVYEVVSDNYRYNDSGRVLSDSYYDVYLYAGSATKLEALENAIVDHIDTYSDEDIAYLEFNDRGQPDSIESQNLKTIRLEIRVFFK